MASVNKVILVGNVGKDPEVRYMTSGDAIANFTLATTDRYKDKASGEMQESTEWHRCSAFGRLAEIVNEYVKKGSPLVIEGSLRTRKWKDQAGVERYTTEIRVAEMQLLGGRSSDGESRSSTTDRVARPASSQQSRQQTQRPQQPRQPAQSLEDTLDNIPF